MKANKLHKKIRKLFPDYPQFYHRNCTLHGYRKIPYTFDWVMVHQSRQISQPFLNPAIRRSPWTKHFSDHDNIFPSLRVYAKYPNHIPSFFQESFPNGYTQRRITRFSRLHSDTDIVDEEGTMETFHEVSDKMFSPGQTNSFVSGAPPGWELFWMFYRAANKKMFSYSSLQYMKYRTLVILW